MNEYEIEISILTSFLGTPAVINRIGARFGDTCIVYFPCWPRYGWVIRILAEWPEEKRGTFADVLTVVKSLSGESK